MKLAGTALSFTAMMFAMPAAAQTAQQDYEAGVAARHAGYPEQALTYLDRAAAAEPGNADIQLQIGFANLALGGLDAAETAFRRTLDLAPDYVDARLGLAQVAHRRGDRAAALAELDRIGPGHAEADQLRRQIESAVADIPGDGASTWMAVTPGSKTSPTGNRQRCWSSIAEALTRPLE